METLLAPHFSGRVVPMSVKEGNGEGDLMNACVDMLESRVRRARFLIPYTRSDLVAAMHSEGKEMCIRDREESLRSRSAMESVSPSAARRAALTSAEAVTKYLNGVDVYKRQYQYFL